MPNLERPRRCRGSGAEARRRARRNGAWRAEKKSYADQPSRPKRHGRVSQRYSGGFLLSCAMLLSERLTESIWRLMSYGEVRMRTDVQPADRQDRLQEGAGAGLLRHSGRTSSFPGNSAGGSQACVAPAYVHNDTSPSIVHAATWERLDGHDSGGDREHDSLRLFGA